MLGFALARNAVEAVASGPRVLALLTPCNLVGLSPWGSVSRAEVEKQRNCDKDDADDHPGKAVDAPARVDDRPGCAWGQVCALVRRVARVVVKVGSANPSDHAAHTCEEAHGSGSRVPSRQHHDEHKADGDDKHPKNDCPERHARARERPRCEPLPARLAATSQHGHDCIPRAEGCPVCQGQRLASRRPSSQVE